MLTLFFNTVVMSKKKVFLGILAFFVVIQLARPTRNEGAVPTATAISGLHTPSPQVYNALQKACFDCHSDHTNYPWYANIQPVGWWLNHHVEEGKEELNFSALAAYPAKKAAHKLEEVTEAVTEHWMPMSSYTRMHPEAVLSDAETQAIASWAKTLQDSLNASK